MCKYLFKVITIIPVVGEVSSVADGKPVRDCALVSALATGYHDVKRGHSFTSSLPSTKCNITGEISTTLSVLLNVLWHGKRKCQVDVNNALTWYNNLCVSLIVLSVRGYSYSYTPALTNQEKHGKYWKSSLGCECMCFRPLPPAGCERSSAAKSCGVCLWVGTFPLTERHIGYWLQPLPNLKWVIFEINVGQTGSRRAPPKSVCLCFPRLRLCRWSPRGLRQHLSADELAPLNNSLLEITWLRFRSLEAFPNCFHDTHVSIQYQIHVSVLLTLGKYNTGPLTSFLSSLSTTSHGLQLMPFF